MTKSNFISEIEQIASLGNKYVTISKEDFLKLIEYAKTNKSEDYDKVFAVLKELVEVKHISETEGKSINYIVRQPDAWENAKKVVRELSF